MPERRKKYEIKLIVILAIIAALIFGACWFARGGEDGGSASSIADTSEFKLLGTADALELMVDGEHFRLLKTEGNWVLEGDPDFKVNSTVCDGILFQMKSLPINRVIENGMDDAELYGLDSVNNWICIETNAGDAKFLIGNYNSVTLEFYIAFENGRNVYMSDYNSIAYCLRPLSNFEDTGENEENNAG